MMSKRLQVLVDEREWREIREVARANHVTVAEWVRQSLRHARRQMASGDTDVKLEAIRTAARCEFPTAGIDSMLREIEGGYLAGDAE